MENLDTFMNKEAMEKFTKNFFSVKRSNKYFCGMSQHMLSDMSIEQSIMKSMKSREGFTHGRSIKK